MFFPKVWAKNMGVHHVTVHLQLAHGKMEAQRCGGICPRPHSETAAEPRFELGCRALEFMLLATATWMASDSQSSRKLPPGCHVFIFIFICFPESPVKAHQLPQPGRVLFPTLQHHFSGNCLVLIYVDCGMSGFITNSRAENIFNHMCLSRLISPHHPL